MRLPGNPYNTNITSLSNYITVYNPTVSGFNGTPTYGLFPLDVQFNLTPMDNYPTLYIGNLKFHNERKRKPVTRFTLIIIPQPCLLTP